MEKNRENLEPGEVLFEVDTTDSLLNDVSPEPENQNISIEKTIDDVISVDSSTEGGQSSECGNNSDFSTADSESENDIRARLRNRNMMRVPDYVDRSSIVTDEPILNLAENMEPLTFQDALHCVDSKKWKAAMDDEIRSLKENST